MNAFIDNFHFLRPLFFLALLPAILVFFLMLRQQQKKTQWTTLIDAKLLPFLLEGKFSNAQKFPLYILLTVWILSTFALAGPTWEKKPQPVQKDVSAMVILWDMSPSMNAEDVKPSRLLRSRLKLVDLLNARKEGLTALIAYAGDAHVVTPLTDDTKTIKSLLPGLKPSVLPEPGSNPERAFELAHDLLKETGIVEGDIVFITDGIARGALNSLQATASGSQHEVTIWGFGTAEGAPIPLDSGGFARNKQGEIVVAKLEHDTLSDAAVKMSGIYLPFTNNNSDIENIQHFSFGDFGKQESEKEKISEQWLEQGHWIVLFVLPFVALLFRRGWLLFLLFGFTHAPNTQALSWADLWLTKDQQAAALLNNKDAEAAADTFKDTQWKAVANYKAGRFEQAQSLFEQQNDASSHYNTGNALTHQGKYDAAIAAYDRALELMPDFEDAKHNRAVAEELKKLQDKQNQNDGNQNQDQDKSEQSNQQQGEKQQGEQQKSGDQDQSQAGNPSQEKQNQQHSSGSQQDQDQQSEPQENKGASERANEEQQRALKKHYQQPQEQEQEQEQNDNNGNEKSPQQVAQPAQQDSDQSDKGQEQHLGIASMSDEEKEQQQALEQWLRKVPDDPSGLLRNKFKYENQLRRRELPTRTIRGPEDTDEQRW